jgi:hypothetical protein
VMTQVTKIAAQTNTSLANLRHFPQVVESQTLVV